MSLSAKMLCRQNVVCFAVSVLLTLTVACQKEAAPIQRPIKIAFVAKLKGESFHDSIASGVRKEMAKLGIQADIFLPKSQQDVETQREALRKITLNGGYDGLMLAPNDSEGLIPFIAEIDKAEIPFILIDTPLTNTEISRGFKHDCGFVGTDNVYAGVLSAQYIAERIGRGSVFLMRGNHKHQSSIDREAGFVSEIRKHKNIHTVGFVQGWWEDKAAYEVFSASMTKYKGSIDAVFAYNDPMALGVGRYFDEHPQVKRPVIVGVDGTLVGQRGLLLRQIDATVVQAPEVMGKVGLANLVKCIKDQKRKENMLTPVTLLRSGTAIERTTE